MCIVMVRRRRQIQAMKIFRVAPALLFVVILGLAGCVWYGPDGGYGGYGGWGEHGGGWGEHGGGWGEHGGGEGH